MKHTAKNIPSKIKLRLFAESAGHCQNPDCLQILFPLEMGGDTHIAEMAHVIPQGKKGPRHESRPKIDFDINAFENLILLCPTCHTKIDKKPEAYPRVTLLEWKRDHLCALATSQGIKKYSSRSAVRKALMNRMEENKAIWKRYAPIDGIEFDFNPESESALIWTQRMRSVILPNHFRILSIIEANYCYASPSDETAIAEYKEHIRGLVERHVCGVYQSGIRFPTQMERIFT